MSGEPRDEFVAARGMGDPAFGKPRERGGDEGVATPDRWRCEERGARQTGLAPGRNTGKGLAESADLETRGMGPLEPPALVPRPVRGALQGGDGGVLAG